MPGVRYYMATQRLILFLMRNVVGSSDSGLMEIVKVRQLTLLNLAPVMV